MQGTKALIQSKTFQGAVAVIVATLISLIRGIEVSDITIMEIITHAMALIGSIISIYGRIIATKEITSIL